MTLSTPRATVTSMSRIVEDNPGQSRFELRVDGELVGWSDYRPAGDSVIVAHTEIDQRREGQGLGSALVRERSITSGPAARPSFRPARSPPRTSVATRSTSTSSTRACAASSPRRTDAKSGAARELVQGAWWASATAITPSATAPATRLVEPCQASRAANSPGTLVSRASGSRRNGQWAGRSPASRRSGPGEDVTGAVGPARRRPAVHFVRGRPPMHQQRPGSPQRWPVGAGDRDRRERAVVRVRRPHLGAQANVDQRVAFDPAHQVVRHRPAEPVAAHEHRDAGAFSEPIEPAACALTLTSRELAKVARLCRETFQRLQTAAGS